MTFTIRLIHRMRQQPRYHLIRATLLSRRDRSNGPVASSPTSPILSAPHSSEIRM
jgi:hypothetical protein